MLRDVRRLEAPELDAFHTQIDVRIPSLRVGVQRGRNVASDYALAQKASPFIHYLRKAELTILLEGNGRFEEDGVRVHFDAGHIAMSDQARAGTEAYTGRECLWMTVEWEPGVLGPKPPDRFVVERIGERDRARLRELARTLSTTHDPATSMVKVLDLLRTLGFPFARVSPGDLASPFDAEAQRLHDTMNARLARLHDHPAIEEVVDDMRWNARRVHRGVRALSERYRLPWRSWREALHYTRLLHAIRLSAAPGATTERVARLTGFRSPAALCHAFAKGGLPSPGVLARAALRDVLDAWSSFA